MILTEGKVLVCLELGLLSSHKRLLIEVMVCKQPEFTEVFCWMAQRRSGVHTPGISVLAQSFITEMGNIFSVLSPIFGLLTTRVNIYNDKLFYHISNTFYN